MKILVGLSIAALCVGGALGQYRGNPQPMMRGGSGSVVYPGGTSATMPNVQRSVPSVVYPGGGGPRLVVPFSVTDPTFASRPGGSVPGQNFHRSPVGRGSRGGAVAIPYAYPVYVGGYGYDAPYANDAAPPEQQLQQQPNIVVIYPGQQPTMFSPSGPGAVPYPAPSDNQSGVYLAPSRQPSEEPASTLDPAHYLIAFKDHTIYSAMAYWVDGDTLHYFTSGNTHNQVSLALVDRPLTERLNRESGVDLKLPSPAK